MSGPAPPGGDTEEKWGLHGLSNLSLGSEWFEPHIGLPSFGSPAPGGQVLLPGLKTSGTDSEAIRNLDPAPEEFTQACFLLKKRWRKKSETAKASDWFPMATTD